MAEVDRRAARGLVRDGGLVQLAPEVRPRFRGDGDGDVMQAAEQRGVRAEIQTGEGEDREQVPVPDVEEEVAGALVVPVLDYLGQRELQDALVEPDRALNVRAEQGGVVDAAGTADRPAGGQVGGPQPGPLGFERGQVDRVSVMFVSPVRYRRHDDYPAARRSSPYPSGRPAPARNQVGEVPFPEALH